MPFRPLACSLSQTGRRPGFAHIRWWRSAWVSILRGSLCCVSCAVRSTHAAVSVRVNLGFEVYVDGEQRPPEIRFDYPDVEPPYAGGRGGVGPGGAFRGVAADRTRASARSCWSGAATCRRVSATSRRSTATARSIPIPTTHSAKAVRVPIPTASSSPVPKSAATTARALEVLRFHGADESILYDAHPHIGTDRLPRIIAVDPPDVSPHAGGEVVVRGASDRRAASGTTVSAGVLARRYAGRGSGRCAGCAAIRRAMFTRCSTADGVRARGQGVRYGRAGRASAAADRRDRSITCRSGANTCPRRPIRWWRRWGGRGRLLVLHVSRAGLSCRR